MAYNSMSPKKIKEDEAVRLMGQGFRVKGYSNSFVSEKKTSRFRTYMHVVIYLLTISVVCAVIRLVLHFTNK